ncbi:hypothetical protein ABK040_016200 [Willaertia magna]
MFCSFNENKPNTPFTLSISQLYDQFGEDEIKRLIEKTENRLFPILDDIKDMRIALKIVEMDLKNQKQPFPYVEKQENGYSFFNYNYMTWFTFGDLSKQEETEEFKVKRAAYLFARECRGVCYDLKTGTCASRGLQKFFNVGEKPETEITLIDFTQPHVILDKMDGTMVCGVLTRNELLNDDNKRLLRFRTKMGWITDPSKLTEKFVYGIPNETTYPSFNINDDEYKVVNSIELNNIQKGYIEFCVYWIKKGYSPIFEFVSPEQQIVLFYDRPSLVLLGLRNTLDGHYLSYKESRKSAEEFGVIIAKPLLDLNNETSLEKVHNFIKEQIGIEGYVVRFNDGTMHKIKSSWYLELHGCKTDNKKITDTDIWMGVLDNSIDDLLSNLQTKEAKEELENFVSNFWNSINLLTEKVKTTGRELKEKYPNRKEYFHEGLKPIQAQNKLFSEFLLNYFDKGEAKLQDDLIEIITKKLRPTAVAQNKKKVKNDVLKQIKTTLEELTGIDLTTFKSKYLEEKKKYDETLRQRRLDKQQQQEIIDNNNMEQLE